MVYDDKAKVKQQQYSQLVLYLADHKAQILISFTYILGSMAAANVFSEKNSPNIIFWSSKGVPAPCLTDLGLDHS